MGPGTGHEDHEAFDGEVMAVNAAIDFCEPDIWVSKHTEELLKKEHGCWKITGDTWTIPEVEQWKLANVGLSGVYALLVGKLLGYEKIRIFGMPALHGDHDHPDFNIIRQDSHYASWADYRQYFEGVTVHGGYLPIWFEELRYK